MKFKDLELRKKDFVKFLKEDFEPNNYKVMLIEFSEIDDLRFQGGLDALEDAGVYGLHCYATNHTLITGSVDLSYRIWTDFCDLKEGFFESPTCLIKDFSKYELECFVFIVFCVGQKWENFKKMHDEIERIKTIWPYKFYEFN